MFDQQVVDKEAAFIVFGFLVDPELQVRDIRVAVMLAEVGEFFIHVTADVAAIHNPDLEIAALFILFQVRGGEFLSLTIALTRQCHGRSARRVS